jgi:spermidine synthase
MIALTSASVLAYEILLMRLISIGQWHHFAYMVISMALLGFGAAGSVLFITYGKIKKNPDRWLMGLAGMTAVFYPLSFALSQKVGLDPLQLIWQLSQWWNMFFTYLLMAIPFLLGGGIIGIVLTGSGEKAHRMYAFDLFGAGCGALAVVPALYLGPPSSLLPILGFFMLVGIIPFCLGLKRPLRGFVFLLFCASLMVATYKLFPPLPRIHETKSLPMTLAFPDARIEAEKVGPLGVIQVVESSAIRHVPGLSLRFGLDGDPNVQAIPEQKALFVDGDGLSPISRFTGNSEELTYLDFTSMALPYHVRSPERALVIGPGGGSDLLLAFKHGVQEVVALEANHQIADLLTGPFADFSGHIYSRPEVRLAKREARQFLHATQEHFDLILLSLIDSFGASAGGLHSASESYLYTAEALQLYLSRLTDDGLLSITRWLKLPPRDSLRIIATALEALRKMGIQDEAGRHVIFIRSWKTATILVSKRPFLAQEIDRTKAFCRVRNFDLGFYAGMKPDEANRYDIQQHPYYSQGASALCGPEAKSFLAEYIFDVAHTTDDRPYFSHFFRWDTASSLLRQLRKEMFPMVEMGYLFVLATLVQALIAGSVLILTPLFFLKKKAGSVGASNTLPTLVYFASIGLAFMFLEMALIPRYVLLLSSPVYSAALVLSTVLVFAGLGSLLVRRLQAVFTWYIWIPALAIFIWVGFHAATGDALFREALGWSSWGRLFLAVSSLAILSFFLGWLFPSGLRALASRSPTLVPWAWGINGCASVVGAVLGKCLAISMGFTYLMFMACGLYFLAVTVFHMWFRKAETAKETTGVV